MRILIACEFSGVVRDAFRKLGHDAWSCDLLDTEREGPHMKRDVVEVLDENWDMIIAHPPCTYLSNAGACRLYPKKGEIDLERYRKGLMAKELFMVIYNNKCPKIAIENPIPSRIFDLPKHSQEIQPYEFGHPYSKKTRLWLKGLPNLKPTCILPLYSPFIPAGTSRKDKSKYGAKGCAHESKPRSVTFQGIADAMSDQWGGRCDDQY